MGSRNWFRWWHGDVLIHFMSPYFTRFSSRPSQILAFCEGKPLIISLMGCLLWIICRELACHYGAALCLLKTIAENPICLHEDVIKWKHITRYWPYVRGNSPVTGKFRAQRPVTRSFDVFFDLRLNKPLSKQSWGWWFETPSCSLWRHYNIFASRCRHEHYGPDSI